jgi:hypothetical protein
MEPDLDAFEKSSGDRPRAARMAPRQKDPQRSRVANGSELLPGIDQRSVWVRRCKELIADFTSDAGGYDNTSAAERNIIRRASVMIVELEQIEVRFATGQARADDLDLYSRVGANMRRLLESVGLRRRARTINEPSLADIMHEDQVGAHENY